jgi:hypothetical protein
VKSVSTEDLELRAGEIQNLALQEPVAITQDGHERFVLLSIDEYRRLQRGTKSFAAEELPDWIVERVAKAEMDPRFADLDKLLE